MRACGWVLSRLSFTRACFSAQKLSSEFEVFSSVLLFLRVCGSN